MSDVIYGWPPAAADLKLLSKKNNNFKMMWEQKVVYLTYNTQIKMSISTPIWYPVLGG